MLIGKHELIYVDERMARTRSTMTQTVPGFHLQQVVEESEEPG